jgi:hypothetical protein
VTWYIDAIDPRGGRAIAVQRLSDLVNGSRLEENAAVAFIGAPLFEPQIIGSRSVGLSMSRLGHSQLGLFVEGEEVPFDSVDAVAEFVRRSYVRGSGGDGGGESGVPPLPAAPDRGDDGFDSEGIRGFEGDEKNDVVARVMGYFKFYADASIKWELGKSLQPERFSSAGYVALEGDNLGIQRLARGALRALREVVRRCPRSSGSSEYLNWCQTLNRAMYIITTLNLWERMRRELRGPPHDVGRWLLPERAAPVPVPYQWFIDQMVLPDGNQPYWTWHLYLSSFQFFHDSQDPVADLARMPVASKHLAGVPEDARNLLSMLSVLTATPADLLNVYAHKKPDDNEARAELVLFAAAYLNLGNERPPPGLDDATSAVLLRRLLSRTELWLSANFPRRVFAPVVESVISSCSSLVA